MYKKLKVGLLIDSYKINKDVANLINQCNINSNYEITHFIICDFKDRKSFANKSLKYITSKKKIIRLFDVIFFNIIVHFENILLSKFKTYSQDLNLDIRKNYNRKQINIKPIISKSGFIFTFNNEDLNLLRNENFDILIRCGSGILKGEILKLPKFGILSFHHGDNEFFRGGPAGFWESYYFVNETGFIIQRLTDELDGGIILFRGSIPTSWFYKLNQEMILKYSSIHMHYVIQKLASEEFNFTTQNNNISSYSNKLYSVPDLKTSLIYLFKLTYRILKKITHRLIGKKTYWGIALGRLSFNSFVFWKSKIIKHPNTDFIADPFIIKKGDEYFLICEEYNFKISKAHISAFKIYNINKLEYLGPVLNESFHLSFPFVFEYDNKYYMTPESFQNNDIRLYETNTFPFDWKLKKVIFNKVSAADTIIFQFGNFWWLFTNIDSTGGSNHHSELHAFYSDDPINSEWISHKSNPIIFSSSGGRNAGVFKKNGKVYRCGQNQEIDNYGKSFSIFEIIELKPDVYIEKLVSNVNPNFFENITGTHHLSNIDDLYAVDFKYNKYFQF
jgi:hypothetical protein